jgi:hypothetical protein
VGASTKGTSEAAKLEDDPGYTKLYGSGLDVNEKKNDRAETDSGLQQDSAAEKPAEAEVEAQVEKIATLVQEFARDAEAQLEEWERISGQLRGLFNAINYDLPSAVNLNWVSGVTEEYDKLKESVEAYKNQIQTIKNSASELGTTGASQKQKREILHKMKETTGDLDWAGKNVHKMTEEFAELGLGMAARKLSALLEEVHSFEVEDVLSRVYQTAQLVVDSPLRQASISGQRLNENLQHIAL